MECVECLENTCEKYYISDLNRYNSGEKLKIYIEAEFYYKSFEDKNIINYMKNDKKLCEFIFDNLIVRCKNDLCYLKLANKICKYNDYYDEKYDENLEKAIIDYLFWTFGKPNDETNILRQEVIRREKIEKEEEEKNSMLLKEFRRKQLKSEKRTISEPYRIGKVKYRTGQQLYRRDLIYLYGSCQICGMENNSLLKASHIKKYSESEKDQAIDFNNGFLLCNHHDGLFDKGLITFDDEGNIIISNKLSEHDKNIYLNNGLGEVKIDVEEEQKKYLKWHRKNVFKR